MKSSSTPCLAEMMNQRGADAFHFVGTNGCADPTAADIATPRCTLPAITASASGIMKSGSVIFKIEAVSPGVRYFMANHTGFAINSSFSPNPPWSVAIPTFMRHLLGLSLPAAVPVRQYERPVWAKPTSRNRDVSVEKLAEPWPSHCQWQPQNLPGA